MKLKAMGWLALGVTLALPAGAAERPREKRRDASRGIERLDTDEDGRVSRAEFQASKAGDRLARLDKDGDGSVTLAEVEAVERERLRQRLLQAFRQDDSDQDGVLSAKEMEAARAARFDRMDADKDGYLSAEELASARGPRQRARPER